MKKITKLLLSLMCVSISLIGCLSNEYPPSSDFAPAILQISHTPSQLAPNVSSATSTPSITPTFSIPTVFPEASEAYLLLQKYLKNDPPCQLPCWGGVTPGASTVSEADEEFMTLRSISSPDFTYFGPSGDAWQVGSLNIFYPLLNTQVHISPGFVASSDNKTVVHINIYSQSIPYENSVGKNYGDKEYNTLLSAYNISQIFSTYGLPNIIYTRADLQPSKFFLIRLLYLDLGIFASYKMPIEEKADTFSFCPSDSLITLDLTSQSIGEGYQDFFQQFGDGVWTTLEKTRHKLLGDAIGLTNEEFSQAIISSPESCFESPKEIWTDP